MERTMKQNDQNRELLSKLDFILDEMKYFKVKLSYSNSQILDFNLNKHIVVFKKDLSSDILFAECLKKSAGIFPKNNINLDDKNVRPLCSLNQLINKYTVHKERFKELMSEIRHLTAA